MSKSNIRLPPKWIELNINKTECATFIATPNEPLMCQCGRKKEDHGDFVKYQHRPETWSPRIHTKVFNTDAYGTIVFEGEHHPNKAHYVRLSYDTNPELIIQLMTFVWNLEMPQLLISIRGAGSNFDMSSRLGKIFQTGLIKAARNTNAWIFSNGLNTGVSKHLGNALNNEKWVGGLQRSRLTVVGIASWGMIENRDELIGRNKESTYSPLDSSKFLQLNPRHSNFLLVDNGSIGKFGGENYLRRRLEKCVASYPTSPNRGCDTPVVVIVLEGGFYTLRQISDYLYDEPPIPVVIFGGTGRSADLISFIVRKVPTETDFLHDMKEKIYSKIMQYFHVNNQQCAVLYKELRNIYRKKNLITVFNPNSTNEEDFDAVILSSIFRSQHWTPLQQLSLTLVWNRVDIAQNEVFIYGRDWSREHLEHAMMEALVSNRLEFVNLLLEHGINMQTFLTASRLEALYSLERMPSKLMRSLLIEFSKVHMSKTKKDLFFDKKHGHQAPRDLTLHDIGVALSHMIGHIYQSSYIKIVAKVPKTLGGSADEYEIRGQTFLQPFDDLFVWAVLTKRHEMSKLLWRHGKGALAKALVAVKLNKFLAYQINAAEKSFTSNMAVDFENYAEEWENLSVSLLDSCYRSNSKMARQLLTMELQSWSKETCLALAVMANHRTLLGHPCCQILLADLWMGALKIKSNTTLKIILGIIFPPFALCWEYKSFEELKLLPHQERTGHAFGIADLLNHELYHIEHPGDPESFMKTHPSIVDHLNNKNQERKTDLAIVVRSIFPMSQEIEPNVEQPQSEKATENWQASQHPPADMYQFTHVARSSPDKTAELNPDQFRLQYRDISQPDGLEAGNNQGKLNHSSFVTTQQSMGLWRKFVEFQKAPITNYMRHTMGYIVFLITFVYVILYSQNPKHPGWVEYYVMAYFLTQFMECIREFIHIDALNMSGKIAESRRHNLWQFGDFMVVSTCLCAGGLRFFTEFTDYGMLIYRVSSIYWNLRLYKYLGVHRFLGPKLAMMRRMLKHMIHFAMIIVVVIISFGIARKAILFPYTDPTLQDIAEAFLEPYMMMFGEVDDLDSLTSHCGQKEPDEDGKYPECPPGYWIVPFAWIVYMLVSNILIVNVLIAVFNGIYEEVDAIAVEVWMFQRFNSVMEFEQKPILPPPFIIICHAISALNFLYENFISCICEEELLLESQLDEDVHPHIIMGNDHSLKSFLSSEEQSMVFDFEEENLDNLTPLLEKETTNTGVLNATLNYINTNLTSTEATTATRQGVGSDKFAFQQMKLVLGELHSELDSQRTKLDKLINCWELDIAGSGNPIGEGAQEVENLANARRNNDMYLDEKRKNEMNISTTTSIDEFS